MQGGNVAGKAAGADAADLPAFPGTGGLRATAVPADRVVGRRLQRIRVTRGMTQRQVADALGLSHKQVQNYESGRSRIVITTLVQFARIFQTSLASLLRDLTEEVPTDRLHCDDELLLISDAELAHLSQLRALPPAIAMPIMRLSQALARQSGDAQDDGAPHRPQGDARSEPAGR